MTTVRMSAMSVWSASRGPSRWGLMLVPFHQGGPHQRIGVCFLAAPEEDRRLGDLRRADAEVVGIPATRSSSARAAASLRFGFAAAARSSARPSLLDARGSASETTGDWRYRVNNCSSGTSASWYFVCSTSHRPRWRRTPPGRLSENSSCAILAGNVEPALPPEAESPHARSVVNCRGRSASTAVHSRGPTQPARFGTREAHDRTGRALRSCGPRMRVRARWRADRMHTSMPRPDRPPGGLPFAARFAALPDAQGSNPRPRRLWIRPEILHEGVSSGLEFVFRKIQVTPASPEPFGDRDHCPVPRGPSGSSTAFR